MLSESRNRRRLSLVAFLLAGILLAGFARVPILRELASVLVVEDSLRPAAAIVALGGDAPFREMEAAKLYRAGLAPQVVVVREAPNAESQALQELKIKKPQAWELGRAVLIQQGVPLAAIITPKDEGRGTLEELQAAYACSLRSEVRDQRSESQRSEIGGRGQKVGGRKSEIRNHRCAGDSRDIEIPHAPHAAYLAVCQRWPFTTDRPRRKRRSVRSGALVAAAEFRVVGRAGISRAGELLCGIPGRAVGRRDGRGQMSEV